jgi:hypothetical protein
VDLPSDDSARAGVATVKHSEAANSAIERTQGLVEEIFSSPEPATGQQLKGLIATMNAVFEAEAIEIGVCRLEPEYASLQFVQTSDGLQICCTHAPPHCSPFSR